MSGLEIQPSQQEDILGTTARLSLNLYGYPWIYSILYIVSTTLVQPEIPQQLLEALP